MKLGIDIDAIKGFLDPDEGEALYELCAEVCARGPCLEVGSYCGKSTVYLGSACRSRGGVLYAVDHHRGSEEHQLGEEYHAADLYDADEGVMGTDAQRRLLAIQEFTELGSGFRIATADLDIRGAGNLLGKQQSGHIAAIGLDLYLQMVEQAVQQLKGAVIEEELDPTLHLNVSAFIPDDYVADAHHRLSLYKRLASSQQVGDLASLHGDPEFEAMVAGQAAVCHCTGRPTSASPPWRRSRTG